MKFSISRNKALLIGCGIILLFAFINRIDFLIGSETCIGKVTSKEYWRTRRGSYSAPVVQFETADYKITFTGETNMDVKIGEKVPVIYKSSDPVNARIFSFTGFWLTPFFWSILPLIVFIAAITSYLKKGDKLLFSFGKNMHIKKENGDTTTIPHQTK